MSAAEMVAECRALEAELGEGWSVLASLHVNGSWSGAEISIYSRGYRVIGWTASGLAAAFAHARTWIATRNADTPSNQGAADARRPTLPTNDGD